MLEVGAFHKRVQARGGCRSREGLDQSKPHVTRGPAL